MGDLVLNRSPKQVDKFRKQYLDKQFLSIDGEGITLENGEHRYTLLAADSGEYIEDYTNGLSTVKCFEFLLDLKLKHPKAIFVIFGGSYDFNMMLRDAPNRNVTLLWKTGRSYVGPYSLGYRHRKTFFIKNKETQVSITVNDVQTFFQTSFINACDEYLGNNWHEREAIIAGKAQRGKFTAEDQETTRKYCFAELVNLTELCTELRQRLDAVGLRPRRWDGPGSVATSLLTRENVKAAMAPTSEDMNAAVNGAYFGGRFELFKFGHYQGDVYEYDINSAYPDAMRKLPNLRHGYWQKVSGDAGDHTFAIYKCRYSIPSVTDAEQARPKPAPCRGKNGTVSYPANNDVWLWSPEARNLKMYCRETQGAILTIDETWVFIENHKAPKPFEFIEPLYKQRKELKAAGNGAHVGIKLGLNSLYGKTAQQLGWSIDENHNLRIPPFHQLCWAGYTTSYCRAKIWEAIRNNLDDVVSIETDAVFSTTPLPVEIGTGLGEWEYSLFSDFTYVMNGTYWATTDSGIEISKYRGFDKGSVTRNDILKVWDRKAPEWKEGYEAQETKFITMGEASHRNAWGEWRRWITKPKRMSGNIPVGSKREHNDATCPVCLDADPGYLRKGEWHPTICPMDRQPNISIPYFVEWQAGTIGELEERIIRERRELGTEWE